MDERLQLRVQRYGWDRSAGSYDRGWQRQLAPCHQRVLEMSDLRPGEEILDVACGTGLVTLPAADRVGPEGRVTAVDLSDDMIERLRERTKRNDLDGRVDVERMNAESLELDDESFDAALCSLGLMYVPNPDRALEELHRVVRPGGRVVAAVWGARKRCGWAGIFPVVDARVRTEVCPLFFALGTGDALARVFRDAGFEDVEADRFSTELEYEDDEEALVAAFEGGAVALAYERFDAETREEAHRDYLETIAPYAEGDGYRVPGEFVVVRGRKPRSPDRR